MERAWMLRITKQIDSGATVLTVEGRLVPPWVDELESSCSQALRSDGLVVDLRSVTFVSDEGRTLLARIYRAGARLVTSGPLMNGLVEELKQELER
jgi:anti-anti-sigma regulatory factor